MNLVCISVCILLYGNYIEYIKSLNYEFDKSS